MTSVGIVMSDFSVSLAPIIRDGKCPVEANLWFTFLLSRASGAIFPNIRISPKLHLGYKTVRTHQSMHSDHSEEHWHLQKSMHASELKYGTHALQSPFI
jgi:hypothetical protein